MRPDKQERPFGEDFFALVADQASVPDCRERSLQLRSGVSRDGFAEAEQAFT